MALQMDAFGLTHVGKLRSTNEDQFLIADLNKSLSVHHTSLGMDHQTRLFGNSQGKLLLVADGMGGHDAGERASTLAVDGIATYTLNTLRWFFRLDAQDDNDFQDDLRAAMEHCQEMLAREVDALPQRRGMGTTLTMALVIWPRMYVVHVGDSRCYLYRQGSLRQLTRDHTLAELRRERDEVSSAEANAADGEEEDKRMAHLLWNVIGGGDDQLRPEVYRSTLEIGDAVVLCTDGLTRHVTNDEIMHELNNDLTAEALCERLVEQANAAGGSDNITVAIARFCEPPSEVCEEAASELPREKRADPLADTTPFPEKPAAAKA